MQALIEFTNYFEKEEKDMIAKSVDEYIKEIHQIIGEPNNANNGARK